MKLKFISLSRSHLWNPPTKAILASALSLVTLAACSKARDDLSAANKASMPSSVPGAPTEFVFPKASCGDSTSTLNQTWYPVYIDNGNVDEIRKKYCADATSTVREKTGKTTVQVASFSSYEKALRFAKAVGGTVDSPVGQTAPGSPVARTANTPGGSTAKSGVLSSKEAGSPINIRSSASTASEIQDTGYAGDTVQIAEQKQGEDGNTWYKVKLTTGADGWVRGDLVSLGTGSATSATSANTTSSASPASVSGSTAGHTGGTSATVSSSTEQRVTASTPSVTTGATSSTVSTTTSPSTTNTTSTAPPPASTASTSGTTRQVVLTTQETDSPINVRSSASVSSDVQDVAYAGDQVEVAEKLDGEDGFTWYKVKFSSGTEGWVRGDFVSSN